MIFIFSLLLFFILPTFAYSWGPFTHIAYGNYIISNLTNLAFDPKLKELLINFSYDYLYGCIIADVIIGKKFVKYLYNCHNWKVACKLWENAKENNEKAFALGYLSHLAQDVVAHNYFIPIQMIRSYNGRTLRHLYWEMRFDSLIVNDEIMDLSYIIAHKDYVKDDKLLEVSLKFPFFSFKTTKRIFDSLLLVQRIEKLQDLIKNITDRSKFIISKSDFNESKNLSIKLTINFLQKITASEVLINDPMGTKNLKLAKIIRKNLRKLDTVGIVIKKNLNSVINTFKSNFKAMIIQ
jgi:hypothetical protein